MGTVIGRAGKFCGGCSCKNATQDATIPDTEDLPCLECDGTTEVPCRYAVIFQCMLDWPLTYTNESNEEIAPFGWPAFPPEPNVMMTYPVVELKKDCICDGVYSQRAYPVGMSHSILVDSNQFAEDISTFGPLYRFPPYTLTGDPVAIEYQPAVWQRPVILGTDGGLASNHFNPEWTCLNPFRSVCDYLANNEPIPDIMEPIGAKAWSLDIESDPPTLTWGALSGTGAVLPNGSTFNQLFELLDRTLPIYVADGPWSVWGQNALTLQNPLEWINLPRRVCIVPVDQFEARTEFYGFNNVEGDVPRFNLSQTIGGSWLPQCVSRLASCSCCDNGLDLCIASPCPAWGDYISLQRTAFAEQDWWPEAATPCSVFTALVGTELVGTAFIVVYCDGETYRLDLYCGEEKIVDSQAADTLSCTCQEPRFSWNIEGPIPCCGGVETCCCDEAVPENLTVSFDCPGFGEDDEFTLTFDEEAVSQGGNGSVTGIWIYTDGSRTIELWCQEIGEECVFVFDMVGTFGECLIGREASVVSGIQCDPFLLNGVHPSGDGSEGCECFVIPYTISA